MNKTKSNQTALKLINKYADRYKSLEEENNNLKKEIKDLSQTLLINKEISSIDDKLQFMIEQQKKELSLLIETKENLQKNNKEYQNRNNQLNCIKESLQQENIILNNKVFMFENIIKAKDNELLLLNRKKESPSNFFIETLITDPSVIVNKLNDELLLYKDIYNKQMKYIKQLKKSLEQSEIVNDNIEDVCHKYKQTIKSLLSTKSISSNELSDYQRTGLQLGISKSNKTLNYSSLSINSRRQTQLGLIQRLEDYEKKTSRKKNKISTESDWIEALSFCDMTQEEFYRYAKSKINDKLCSMIEYLYKLIVDKNNHLQLLIKENETLSIDNLRLNKNNLELIDELHLEIEEKNISYIANNEKESQEEETNYNSKDFNKFFEQIKESITSTEFNEGMAVDQFELESKMSN